MKIEVILGFIAILAVIALAVYRFIKLDKEHKIACVKECLKWAVVQAEKTLGGGTGQLKLREVYNLAIQQFPWLVTLVTFEVFAGWVDEALDWMREQIEKNKAINNYINK